MASWATAMFWSCSVSNTMKMPTTERPIVTSYEIICADARRPPSSDQLLLLDQPAITVPYIAIEPMAKMYSRPQSGFAATRLISLPPKL